MNPSSPQPDAHSRVSSLLLALATVSAELGPLFIHSEHGKQMLQTGILTVVALSNQLGVPVGATKSAQ